MGGIVDTQSCTDVSSTHLAAHDAPRPHLVLLFEQARPLAGGARYSLAKVDRVTIGRGDRRAICRLVEKGRPTLQVTVPDERVSLHHASLERDGSIWILVDHASTNGSRVNRVRVGRATLSDGDVLHLGGTLFRYRSSIPTPVTAAGDVDSKTLQGISKSFGTLLPSLQRDLETLARVARSGVTVLLLGETGTGKEVLARSIHECSGRTGRFVAVNCGALPVTLAESLFFGHRRGAFSGAVHDEIGFVRAAHGGTLFLDEIGDLPDPCQAVLLRVLQDREVVPVGATRGIEVDLRVVAATHRPLSALVESGRFRQDLFARLSAFTCAVPRLRDRLDDIGVLIGSILGQMNGPGAMGWSIGSQAAYGLLSQPWPHNVRELEQRLKVGALLAKEGRIELTEPAGDAGRREDSGAARRAPVSSDDVRRALREASSVSAAAKMLRIHRSHLYRLIRQFGIDVPTE